MYILSSHVAQHLQAHIHIVISCLSLILSYESKIVVVVKIVWKQHGRAVVVSSWLSSMRLNCDRLARSQ